MFFQSRIFKVLALFLIGFVMGRNGRYKKFVKDQQLLWKVALAGLVVGLSANYFMAVIMEKYPRAYYGYEIQGWYRTVLYSFGVAPLAIGYVALFFLFAFSGIGKFFVRLLHPLGKMAFTNYLAQSFIATIFFMPFGFNMMGKLGAFYSFLFAVAVFIVQILISNLWLRFFLYGPVEWLWRSASYGKWQKMKKPSAIDDEIEKPELTAA